MSKRGLYLIYQKKKDYELLNFFFSIINLIILLCLVRFNYTAVRKCEDLNRRTRSIQERPLPPLPVGGDHVYEVLEAKGGCDCQDVCNCNTNAVEQQVDTQMNILLGGVLL